MENIFRAPDTPKERYTSLSELAREAVFVVRASFLERAGFHVPVVLTFGLETRLEVPFDWQGRESIDARLTGLLAAARAAMWAAPGGTNPVTFTVVINDNTADQPENVDLEILYDGFALIVDFACDDADSSALSAALDRLSQARV